MTVDWNAIGALGAWFSGGTTLLAVILLLTLQRRMDRRGRPCLSARLDPQSSDCIRYVSSEFSSQNDQREELWIRIAVENSGENAARNVEVRLLNILRENAKEPESRSNLWFKAASLDSTSINMLPRGMKQHFDIAFVRHLLTEEQPSLHLVMGKPDLKPWQQEKTRIEQDRHDNKLEAGVTYIVSVAVLSNDADAVFHSFSIRLNLLPKTVPRCILGEHALKGLVFVQVV
jgi:hypothetical protein